MQAMMDLPTKSSSQRVLQQLIKAKHGQRFYFFGEKLPPGYVPLKDITPASVGGSDGPRRIRAMRQNGIDIEPLPHTVLMPEGGKKRTWCYMLHTDIEQIDMKKCRLKEKEKVA